MVELFKNLLFLCVHHSECVEIGGQLCGVRLLLPPLNGCWGWNPCHQSGLCRSVTLLSLSQALRVTFSVELPVCVIWPCSCVWQALVGEKACYQSISSYGGQIFYLGTKVRSSDAALCVIRIAEEGRRWLGRTVHCKVNSGQHQSKSYSSYIAKDLVIEHFPFHFRSNFTFV